MTDKYHIHDAVPKQLQQITACNRQREINKCYVYYYYYTTVCSNKSAHVTIYGLSLGNRIN